ncbi:betaine/proline/choline family ABC transporter ATP-binding protein [Halanaerobiaceae bacterium Z-7014]|uniref:Quaternary amine transport ATP-binding protein n=1 Tax=Halonatronomonas betaini TaxID=2778430 RepID=A0A931APX5_9FIRM|nr:betaine/proline/choline family ABC transporter ATP-binding protein [Halonatronomonas betaini]MBF8435666.1 betaine/proline/choline family ABC transporter ATP-binding protein [Halonatronomonas betaini]
MIELKNISKTYPGEKTPAVDNLSLKVEKGEICVLVGPSGCGKTTTLKMINRLIEPSSGKIFINGKDAIKQNPNELRQDIGYVIQDIGLFPHMTVAENIATVPKLKDWEQSKIDQRVDELLNLIGLDPENTKDNYPAQLSGGQKQRIGVARAMAVDPPIMLMDEPFAAVDPITRTQLQNEFLSLQKKIQKTICFVTHDIDEAIKMGDKIAILNQGKLVQYDTPENILFNPKNEFVEDFVGPDRSLKVLNLLKVNEIMKENIPTATTDSSAEEVLEKINVSRQSYILIIDKEEKLVGYVNKERIKNNNKDKNWKDNIKFSQVISSDASLIDALTRLIQNNQSILPVTSDENNLIGIVRLEDIQDRIADSYQAEAELEEPEVV